MKTSPIRLTALALVLATVLVLCAGCGGTTINGVSLDKYTLVYDQDSPDYCLRAAEYIQQQIMERTGIEIPVCEADSGSYDHEIIVGKSDRGIAKHLPDKYQKNEFYIMAQDGDIALAGDYFLIAAAAYYFVETYIPGKSFESTVPEGISIHEPITETPNNFIFLIGDGMGVNHTKLFGTLPMPGDVPYHDGEDVFYGYYLPYQGLVYTYSLSGTTDSAAGATALACGVKTFNGYVGKDENLENVQSLTELAASKGMATAVMSTDLMTGATPAGFSAHAEDRDDSDDILACQRDMMQKNGTIFECGLHGTEEYQEDIAGVLERLEESENGFFLMYEEGYIDKFSHKWNLEDTYASMFRFNQVIGMLMEYAFYHPDTFLLITADHETGGLTIDGGEPEYNHDGHTNADVPIFAYGQGAEAFRDYHGENVDIPKTIAKLWGVDDFGA